MSFHRCSSTWVVFALAICVASAGCQRHEAATSVAPGDSVAVVPPATTDAIDAATPASDETPVVEESPLPTSAEIPLVSQTEVANESEIAVVDQPQTTSEESTVKSATPAPPAFSGKELPADTPQPEDVQRKLKSYDDGYVAEVIELLLTYPQASVRAAAAERLSYLSKEDDINRAVLGLRGALRDPSPAVRAEALARLGSYGLKAKDALPEYIRLISDADENVRSRAYYALQALGAEAAPAVPTIARLLASKEYGSQDQAIGTLGTIGPAAKSTAPLLESKLTEFGNDAVPLALARMGVEAPLLKILTTGEDWQRSRVAEGSRGLAKPSPQTIAALIKICTSDSYEYGRANAAESLGYFQPSTKEITAALVKALQDESETVRRDAATSLGKVEPKFDEAIGALVAATKDEKEWVREAATASLGKYQGAADARLNAIVDGMLKIGRVPSYSAESAALSNGTAEFYPLLVKLARDAQADDARRALAVHGIVAMCGNEKFATEDQKREIGELMKRIATDAAQPPTLRAAANCSLRTFRLQEHEDPALWITGVEQGTLPGTRAHCINFIGWEKVAAGIPATVKALEDADKDVASTAISSIVRFGPDAAPAVPVLVKLLKDSKHPHRSSICEALGEIGLKPELCLPALAPAIDDKDNGGVRSSAMRAIARLIAKNDLDAKPWIPQFLARLPKEESYNRDSVVNALKELGPKAAPATPQLVALLTDESEFFRKRVAVALGEIGPGAKDAAPALLEAIKTWKEPDDAIEALGKIKHGGDEFAVLVPKLFENIGLRHVTLEALGSMGSAAAPATPHIVKLLESSADNERYGAAETLGKIGEGAKAAVPQLKQIATDDKQEYVRRIASDALNKVAPNDPALAELVLATVKDLNDYQLEKKLKEWGDRGPQLVRTGLASTSAGVRAASYRLLPLVVAEPQKTVPVLQKALGDEDAGVQLAAALTLDKLNHHSPQQLAVLIGGLGRENVEEWTLKEAIEKSGSAAFAPLVAVITDSAKSDEARNAAVETLSELPLRYNLSASLRAALASSDTATREWAAIALARSPRDKAAALTQIAAALQDPKSPRFQPALRAAQHAADYNELLPPDIATALVDAALRDDEHTEQVAGIVGYRELPPAERDRIVALVADETTRERALKFARRLHQLDARLTPQLLSHLDQLESYEQHMVMNSIAHSGTEGLAQLAAFALDNTKPTAQRAVALQSLGQSQRPSADEREQFAALLASDDADLRSSAAIALATWNYDWKAVETHLLAALQGSDARRYAAASALGVRRADARNLLDKLLPLVATGDEEQRSTALGVVAAVAPDSPTAAAAVVAVIRNSTTQNYNAMESLAAFGALGRGALLTAIAEAKSDDERRRLLAALPHVKWNDGDREKAAAVARAALKSSSPEVQIAAALALPSIDSQAIDVLPILLPIIETKIADDDDDSDRKHELESRRWAALEALRHLKAGAKPAVPALVKLLDDKEGAAGALSLLAAIGPDAAPATAKIVPLLASDDSAWYHAIEALISIGPGAQEAVPALTTLLSNERRATQAARALAEITSPAQTLPLIYKNLKHPTLRYAAIDAIGGLGEKGAAATPVLAKALTVDDPDLRVAAAQALRSIGKPAAAAAPALVAALASDDAPLRVAAASALGAIEPDPAVAVQPLTKALAADDRKLRRAAAYALGGLGKQAAPAVPPLQALVPSEDVQLATAAIVALGQIGPPAAPAIPELMRLIEGESQHAGNAADALGNIGPVAKEAVPLLVKLHEQRKYGRRVAIALWKIDPVAAEQAGVEQPPSDDGDE